MECTKIGNIFKHTSASVFWSKCKKSFCEKTKLKISHGLTSNVEKKRQVFHRCKRKYSHIKNKLNKSNMKNVSKLYKTQLNKSYCEYEDKTANIIREKSRTDPKGLWKILNNIDKKKNLMLVIM